MARNIFKENATPFAYEIPYLAVEEDMLVHADGSYTKGLMLSGLDTWTLPDTQLNELSNHLKNLIVSISSDIELQFFYVSDDQIQEEISQFNRNLTLKNEIQKLIFDDRQKIMHTSLGRRIRIYLFLTKRFKDERGGYFGKMKAWFHQILGPNRKRASVFGKKHREALRDLNKACHDIIRHLSQFSRPVLVKPMKEEEYSRLLCEWLNPKKFLLHGENKSAESFNFKNDPLNEVPKLFMSLREKLTASSCEEYENRLILDETFIRVITFNHFPDNTYPAMMDAFLYALDFPFRMTVAITPVNTQQLLEKIRAKGRRKRLFLGIDYNRKFKNAPTEVAVQEIDEIDELLTKSGEKLVSVGISLVITGESEEELDRRTKTVLMTAQKLQSASARTEEYCQLKYFVASLPGGSNLGKDRLQTCTAQNAADLLPLCRPCEGTKEAWALLHTDRQTIFRFSPFSAELSSFVQIVIGQTGMGKSFLINILLNLYLLKNPDLRIFILDVGGSYRKFTQIWGGQYVDFDLNNPKVSINPFIHGQAIWDAQSGNFNAHTISTIASIAEQMVIDQGQEALGMLDYSVLEQAIRLTYKHSSSVPNFGALQKTLQEYDRYSKDAEDIQLAKVLGKKLNPWTQGPYSKVFSGSQPLEISKPIFCFDLLGSLEDKKRLQGVIMSTITHLLFQKMIQDHDPKIFIGDEIWVPMSHRSGELFFDGHARMGRKHHLSMMLSTQGSSDFQQSKSSKTVLNQSKIRWILKLRENPEEMQKILQLTDRELDLAKHLTMSRGEYSQALFQTDEFSTAVTLYATPLLYWLSTTNPRDRKLEDLLKQNLPEATLMEILKQLSKENPKGFIAEEK
ncbi:MAG: DUF87 domain-containing protein [Deltaproteobacteria bacterium]|nr:DUF87 domain-containing protein [Deltaproteobacteria bacterium]